MVVTEMMCGFERIPLILQSRDRALPRLMVRGGDRQPQSEIL